MILKTDAEGRIVRLRDVARIELGAQGYDQTCTLDGKPSVALAIYQLPGSNALETAERVRAKMEELEAALSRGRRLRASSTTPRRSSPSRSARSSRRCATRSSWWRSWCSCSCRTGGRRSFRWSPCRWPSSAPSRSWPRMGFSLNNLTLFGLVLAIGIVVDDAIVVVEAVEHHIEQGLAPREADDQGHGRRSPAR